jgi:DNA end-binding protein Ku
MAARAIWTGTLKLGSKRLPVKLYSAVEDQSIHFHIGALGDEFDLESFHDEYRDRVLDFIRDEQTEKLLKLVERKRARHKDVVETEIAEREPAKVVDLMEVLKSLAGKKA